MILVIDHQYGVWFDIWQELTNTKYQKEALDKMLGTQKKSELPYNASKEQILYIPLHFWFNRNIGLSLPLVALTYASVKISIKLRKLKDLILAVSKKEYVPDNLTEWPNDNSTPETGIYNLSLAILRGKYKQLKVKYTFRNLYWFRRLCNSESFYLYNNSPYTRYTRISSR